MLSPDEFREWLLRTQRPTREMLVTPGDPGCEPITKISGVPWWPEGTPRPTCSHGHLMSFMAQFRLSDVPSLEQHRDSLVSFHYCDECSLEGNMTWGWDDPEGNTGYDVSVLTPIAGRKPDGLGTVAEVAIDPHSVQLRDVMEVVGYEDVFYEFGFDSLPEDYPQEKSPFDENVYPGAIHVSRSKLGGWVSWLHECRLPPIEEHERLHFIGQLDWKLCPRTPWCSGGYAYLFLISSEGKGLRGKLEVQTG